MGRKCSVESCTSDSTKPEHTGVTFHKVPHHSDVRPKWLSLCRIPDNKSTAKLLFVCSRHFLRADFCSFKGKKYMLRQGVLPSVFPWDKSRLEAIMAEVSGKKEDNDDKEPKKKQQKAKDVKTEPPVGPDIKEEETEVKVEPKEEKIEESEEVKQENVEIKEEIDDFDKHQMTQEPPSTPASINFAINARIEVLDNNNVWYPAKINEVDYEENEILIHFEKFSNKYDEWISMSSPRLRPLQPRTFDTYAVGERCMAIWCDSRKFPATVTKIVDNETYEVLFDDGFVKTVKNHKMFKMNVAKPAQASPLFDPVKGTKQDRRDKKRKLNVAALFGKKARLSHSEKAKTVASAMIASNADESYLSPASQDEANASDTPLETWRPKWDNGRPVGIESTIDSIDGLRKSVIVADPRLPVDWCKHLSQRMYGNSAGKWDTIIVAPDGKKFRTKMEIKNYLDLHPGIEANLEMFDFSIYRSSRKRRCKPKPKPEPAVESSPPAPPEEPPVEEPPVEPEPPVSLKIVFENNAYKCPIEGCGKNFRRENLALMHVKHYHSEYTKYLDNTPNVADLAYARTVGESLDRSPGPTKGTTPKVAPQDKISVAPKASRAHVQSEAKAESPAAAPEAKSKDSEIIKLLNQKPPDVSKAVQPLPSGLPSNMYPEINLKDLLEKSDEIAMRDDINIKNLCSSRPPHGIKTLLPVRPAQPLKEEGGEEKPGSKRKRVSLDSGEAAAAAAAKGMKTSQPEHSTQPPLPPSPPILPSLPPPPPPQPPSPPPATVATPLAAALELEAQPSAVVQFESVIIEGGKIIKLERMKQEEIINCTCGFTEEDGLMIQCELCLCWQHAYCNNIAKESEVPEKYVCYICQHPLLERASAKYLHDQDWLKQGVLPVASYHTKDQAQLSKRFDKMKKCSDLSGGLLELKEFMHTLGVKLKIAGVRNHPKLYLWSKPWEKPKLPEKIEEDEQSDDVKPKLETDHQYIKSELDKGDPRNDSMLMMMLKSDREQMPMLNMHNSMAPIIPRPEAAIDSDDCRLNLLEHISHAENLVEERLDQFEKQLDLLEEGMNVETEADYPRTRQTLQLLMRDLDTIRKFSELPTI